MFKRVTKPVDCALQICLIGCIRLYRAVISPWMGLNCRFYPSCSQYALDSLRQHGGWRGGWLIIKRLLRCHPWHCGGYDPVKTEIKKVR